MRRARRGFSFIELLVVLIVMGILASLAVLKYIDLKHRAKSAQVIGDLQAVRLAAYNVWYETGTWPADAGAGTIPAGLVPHLGTGFTFSKPDYTLDFENFVPPDGGATGTYQLGVVFTSTDTRLINTLIKNLGNKAPFFVLGGNLTFVIVGPDGRI
jgi:prepilin-type N-terminal cleavage/methylation domain-containing protein